MSHQICQNVCQIDGQKTCHNIRQIACQNEDGQNTCQTVCKMQCHDDMPLGGDHSKKSILRGSIEKPKQLGRPEFCDLECVRIEVQEGLASKGGAFTSDLGHNEWDMTEILPNHPYM